jgi:glycosyltransferase involved in cell wall biosynthesis
MNTPDQPLVSIVTPVYNGEKYIDECIRSVRRQTYSNWEYVILNNCSTDRTLEIAQKHQEEDRRVRIVCTRELLPLIQNHNHALRQISPASKYCKMLHADDTLFPACLEQMVQVAEAFPTVGMVGSYGLWGTKVVSDGLPLETIFVPGKELGRLNLLNQIYCFWSPSALLIRSDIIRRRGDFYAGSHLHADVAACYETLKESDFGFVHQVLTFIRRHEDSMTSVAASPLNRTILSNLDLLHNYGPVFLTDAEFNTHWALKTRQYYHFLASSLFQLKGMDFWRYHREFLKQIGYKLHYASVFYAAFTQLIARPKKTLTMLVKSAFKTA